MKNIRVEKLTLNFGAGKDQSRLEKGIKLLKIISGKDPIKTISKHRIPTWGLRLGLPVGCKITLRGKDAVELLKRLLQSKDSLINPKSFDNGGNFSFGVPDYLDVPDTKYDADVGIMGFEAAVTLARPGFRIKKRKYLQGKIASSHKISKEDAMKFITETYSVKVEEEE